MVNKNVNSIRLVTLRTSSATLSSYINKKHNEDLVGCVI